MYLMSGTFKLHSNPFHTPSLRVDANQHTFSSTRLQTATNVRFVGSNQPRAAARSNVHLIRAFFEYYRQCFIFLFLSPNGTHRPIVAASENNIEAEATGDNERRPW